MLQIDREVWKRSTSVWSERLSCCDTDDRHFRGSEPESSLSVSFLPLCYCPFSTGVLFSCPAFPSCLSSLVIDAEQTASVSARSLTSSHVSHLPAYPLKASPALAGSRRSQLPSLSVVPHDYRPPSGAAGRSLSSIWDEPQLVPLMLHSGPRAKNPLKCKH